MAGTSVRTKLFGLRVPIDLWNILQVEAKAREVSIAALLLGAWGEPEPKAGRPPKDEKDARIASLIVDRDVAQTVVASLEGRIAELESYAHGMAEILDAKNAEIAHLKKAVAASQSRISPKTATGLLRPVVDTTAASVPSKYSTDGTGQFPPAPVGSLLKAAKGKP